MYRLIVLLASVLFANNVHAESYALGVDGLACPFCAYGVEKQLNRIDGVTNVRIEIGKNLAVVETQDGVTLSEQRAQSAVEDAGFTLRSFALHTPKSQAGIDEN